MIKLRWLDGHQPQYMTAASAAADLFSRQDAVIAPGKRAVVATGVWIEELSDGESLYELQIRARSGLALKKGVQLANGVGTIDADYRDEICVLLINLGDSDFVVKKGERIAQMILNQVKRIPGLEIGGLRIGGLGSTGITTNEDQAGTDSRF